MRPLRCCLALVLAFCAIAAARAGEAPLRESWDYVPAMKKVAARFRGRPGVVLHVGDSITYANPYGQWARSGQGKTADDKTILGWMHCGADDATDGWWLCRFDHPDGGRSHTAASGARVDQVLAGGYRGLPSLAAMLRQYRPQMVVLMLGTNDASAGRAVDAYAADMRKCVEAVLGQGAICILSTIPPHPQRGKLAAQYNEALRKLAKDRGLPLIDYEREILSRRPNDWNGTLLGRNNVHPTVGQGDVNAASAPTPENLRASGYLLRGWLSVRKIVEVKRAVLDGQPLPPRRDDTPPAVPAGDTLRLPVTRDTWFSNVGDEADCNTGGSQRLKLKSTQEMTLLDVDPAPLRGRVIEAATLHLRLAGKERLHRVTVASFASPWVEGTAASHAPQQGSSTFNYQRHPDVPWAFPGSDLTAVTLGAGGTIWRMADASAPDAGGWQGIPVDPAVLSARAAGISHGLLVFDDTGSEWTRQGERFTYGTFPNRFVTSRHAGEANAPYLTVSLGAADREPPEAPAELREEPRVFPAGRPPAGHLRVTWRTPQDRGPAGVIGFEATVAGKPVPRWMVPAAGKPGDRVLMRLGDLGLEPGSTVEVTVRAVDAAGNVGPAGASRFEVSSAQPEPLPGRAVRPFDQPGPLPQLAGAKIAIVDPLDKVHPVTGRMIPDEPAGYLSANHLWSAKEKTIRLGAARNEFVAFQVLVEGRITGLEPSLAFSDDGAVKPRVEWGRFGYVASKGGPLPDPVVPLDGALDVPNPKDGIAGQTRAALLCEVYVPHDAPAGAHHGTLTLRSGGERLELPVTLWVWSFTLPDYLSFLPEMNCYGLPQGERDYYRLAHRHRTVLNRVPYSQSGSIHEGCSPTWDGHRLDWAAWDKRFGPLLDGTAFADLPRRGVPLEVFYLPLHENWPTAMEDGYRGGYWADSAFSPQYRRAFVEASRQMAEHFAERGWRDTIFQGYLNNKVNFKQGGWSRGSSPWLLDEPANFQDTWALRFFGAAFCEGAGPARSAQGGPKMLYRCDISRPQWQRNSLDHVLGYNVVGGGPFRRYHRLVMQRKEDFHQVVVDYGTTNPIEASNMQPVGWCLDSWTLGSDGVLPWQTVGRDGSWKQADQLALFYPGGPAGLKTPVPSIRLKAYRRGQQDVEYLQMWQNERGRARWAMRDAVLTSLKLKARQEATGAAAGEEDAGRVSFAELRPQDAWALRVRVAKALSQLGPKPQRRVREWVLPTGPALEAPASYVRGHRDEAAAAHQAAETGPAEVKVLQGRRFVRDAIIDPEAADKSFGAAPRDNRLMRRETCNALLVRFELAGLKLPKDAKVHGATVSFYVWDPSSKGNTKVAAFGLKTPWNEGAATWAQPGAGKKWKGGAGFAFGKDTGPAGPHVVVPPDQGGDTADPPLEYRLDVTELVRAWVSGAAPNDGLAIAPVIDHAVDNGQWSRFQVLASEHSQSQYTPKLEIRLGP